MKFVFFFFAGKGNEICWIDGLLPSILSSFRHSPIFSRIRVHFLNPWSFFNSWTFLKFINILKFCIYFQITKHFITYIFLKFASIFCNSETSFFSQKIHLSKKEHFKIRNQVSDFHGEETTGICTGFYFGAMPKVITRPLTFWKVPARVLLVLPTCLFFYLFFFLFFFSFFFSI